MTELPAVVGRGRARAGGGDLDSLIGAPLARREDARVLRGETCYLDDIERPGVLHAAFVRSPHASATIGSIAVPQRADGLAAVLTATDLGGVAPFPVLVPRGMQVLESEAHPVLARDEVRYAGQPVAIVVATTRALAEDAAELVEVDYEPRTPVLDVRGSDLEMLSWSAAAGDVEGAFAAAAHIVSGAWSLPRLAAAPMEARGCLAEHEPGADLLTVWCSAQDVHRPLAQLAHILGRDQSSLRVIVPDVGGAFGSKGVIAPEVAAAAVASIRLGRPVKWVEDRLENLVGAYQGRGIEGELELALSADGRMLALRARLWADLGGYLLTTTPMPPNTAATLICGCYDIDTADVRVVGTRTNRAPTGPYRGAGRPDAIYMLESLVDQAARATGIDRVALRRRNLVRRFPHRTPTGLEYDSGDFERCLDLALELGGPDPDPVGPDRNVIRGSGVALYVERAGGAFESAEIELLDGGRFSIASSSRPHGQGHDITFAQIAADRLKVGVDAIELSFGDSATSPAGMGTYGSRSVSQAGSAIALATQKLERAARDLAVAVLAVEPAAVRRTAAGFAAATGAVSWAGLAAAALDPARQPPGRQPSPLRADARFESANVFSSGAYAASVRIERSTGELTVQRLVAVDDAGTLINPLLVHGQVLGGCVQALGECLTEEVVYDEAGQPRSGSFLDYGLLTAAEIPPIVTAEVQTPSPLNPLGAKGAGEGGAVGTVAAVANAVADALGGRQVSPPFTAEKLWRALHEGERVAAPSPADLRLPAPVESPLSLSAKPTPLLPARRSVLAPISRAAATAAAVAGTAAAVSLLVRRRRRR
ncbi:MAG: xanthine dehydrogenase family protein molybdopterin-binding subunit [Solirubrobacteraceae bacterium]